MNRKWILISVLIVFLAGFITVYFVEPEYAYIPPNDKVLSKSGLPDFQKGHRTFDIWGHTIPGRITNERMMKKEGRSKLSPSNGAVAVDQAVLELGREAFYAESFGNEVFLTDIMGIVNGPFTIPNIAKAILELKGQGTTNLRVKLAETVSIGEHTYKKGTKIDTGIDVAKGAYVPLGMPVKLSEGRVKVGLTCIACHATVDRDTGMVIEGAPNSDLNAGMLLALATNSTAYFTHAEISAMTDYMKDMKRKIIASDGSSATLPDADVLEKKVDEIFASWPPGNFDSTIDIKSNPSQIPDSFTLGDHPYGWSGQNGAGPFKGLSAFSNNVHAQNSDSLSQADASPALFGIDKEVYLGTILQNAANPKYRFDPNLGMKPSEFFASVDPTPGAPGVNEMIPSPTYPKVSLVAPDGMFVGSPGFRTWEQINAMSAWQNTVFPPRSKIETDEETNKLGKEVFIRAGCISCHAGDTFTNNKIISANVIGTEPSRAKAFKKTEKIFADAKLYSFDTPVPLPGVSNILGVPTGHLDPEQIKLALAHGNSPGGYKVPSLIGLYWTAPYLHDGGVAVGHDAQTQLGVAGTLLKGIQPDPANSLIALVDRELRAKVIRANQAQKGLQQVHVQGIGHEYWVDESTGFTKEEQEAMVLYLLNVKQKVTGGK
jgi:hypothetical protein